MGCQRSAMFVETVFFKSRRLVFSDVRLFKAAVALYYVNDVFGVAVDVMGDRPGFICRVECA